MKWIALHIMVMIIGLLGISSQAQAQTFIWSGENASITQLCWPFTPSGVSFWQFGCKSAMIEPRTD